MRYLLLQRQHAEALLHRSLLQTGLQCTWRSLHDLCVCVCAFNAQQTSNTCSIHSSNEAASSWAASNEVEQRGSVLIRPTIRSKGQAGAFLHVLNRLQFVLCFGTDLGIKEENKSNT